MEGMPAPDLSAPVQMSRVKYQKPAPAPAATWEEQYKAALNQFFENRRAEEDQPGVHEDNARRYELIRQFRPPPVGAVQPWNAKEFLKTLPIEYHEEFNRLESDRTERIKRYENQWKIFEKITEQAKEKYDRKFPQPGKGKLIPPNIVAAPASRPAPIVAGSSPAPIAARPVDPKPVAVAPRPAPRPIVAAPRPVAPAPAAAPKLAAAPRLPIPVAPKPLVAVAPKPAPNLGAPQPGAV